MIYSPHKTKCFNRENKPRTRRKEKQIPERQNRSRQRQETQHLSKRKRYNLQRQLEIRVKNCYRDERVHAKRLSKESKHMDTGM